MAMAEDRLCFTAGAETESLINFIFNELPDEIADQVMLDRIVPEGGGVARELVTTGAILTFGSALAVQIFRLIDRWMEQRRQSEVRRFIYEAARENPEALKALGDLEKLHSNVVVELAKARAPLQNLLKVPAGAGKKS